MSVDATDTGEVVEISRAATGKRIALTLFYILVIRVVETVLAAIILFELACTLFTKRTPSRRVRGLAERVVRYGCQVGHFVTYNKQKPPFPFEDFPREGEAGPAHDNAPALG